jgi:hypothetical protein
MMLSGSDTSARKLQRILCTTYHGKVRLLNADDAVSIVQFVLSYNTLD